MNPLELSPMNFLGWCAENIKYGYITKDRIVTPGENAYFVNHWELQQNDTLLETKVGMCYDFVELERYFFDKKKIESRTFCISAKEKSHTFLVFKLEKDWYWFECAWGPFLGIKKIGICKSLFDLIRLQLQLFCLIHQTKDVTIWEYFKPKTKRVNFYDFNMNIIKYGTQII